MPDSSRIKVFRDHHHMYTRLRPRVWLGLLVAGALAAGVAGNLWWLSATLSRPALEQELEEHAKMRELRQQAMERIGGRTAEIEQGLAALRENDAALRAMIHLDKEAKKAAQGLQAPGKSPQDTQLLQTAMEVQAAFLRALNRPVRFVRADAGFVERSLEKLPSALGCAPDAWPVRGVISSEFGSRLSPFAGREEFHKGVDIMAPAGSAVWAPAPGVVAFAGEDAEGTLAVIIDHGGGYVSTFSHMQRLEAVTASRVERGQRIGFVGQEGRATGPHLHYEIRLHGVPVDPQKYLP